MDKNNKTDFIGDNQAYLKYRRGGRNQTAVVNKESFLVSGQNGLISALTIFFYLVFFTAIRLFSEKSLITKISSFLYRTLFTTFLFQFQMISIVELESHSSPSSTDTAQPLMLKLSPYLSATFLGLIIIEIYRAYDILDKKRSKRQIESMSSNEKAIFGVYTAKLHEDNLQHPYKIMLYQQCKYLLIQVIVGGLPLFPKVQVTVVLMIVVLFMVYFVKATNSGHKIFKLNAVYLKVLTEEVCILMVLFSMWIFVFFGETEFSKSALYGFIEYTALTSIVLAALFQIVMIVCVIVHAVIAIVKNFYCKKEKKEVKRSKFYVDNVVETEGKDINENDVKIDCKGLGKEEQTTSQNSEKNSSKKLNTNTKILKINHKKDLRNNHKNNFQLQLEKDKLYIKNLQKSEDFDFVTFREFNKLEDIEQRYIPTQRGLEKKIDIRKNKLKGNFRQSELDKMGNDMKEFDDDLADGRLEKFRSSRIQLG